MKKAAAITTSCVRCSYSGDSPSTTSATIFSIEFPLASGSPGYSRGDSYNSFVAAGAWGGGAVAKSSGVKIGNQQVAASYVITRVSDA